MRDVVTPQKCFVVKFHESYSTPIQPFQAKSSKTPKYKLTQNKEKSE
jgi:hypothetical protein